MNEKQKEKTPYSTRSMNFGCHFSEPYEPKPVLNAALTVVRGHSAPMDLVRVETKSEVLKIMLTLFVCIANIYMIFMLFFFCQLIEGLKTFTIHLFIKSSLLFSSSLSFFLSYADFFFIFIDWLGTYR